MRVVAVSTILAYSGLAPLTSKAGMVTMKDREAEEKGGMGAGKRLICIHALFAWNLRHGWARSGRCKSHHLSDLR